MESLTVGHAGLTESLSSSRHMYVKVKIGNETLYSLVDTGASGFAFISESMSQRLRLPCHTLPSPVLLVGFEGKRGPLVTHEASFTLTIGRHTETVTAYITNPSTGRYIALLLVKNACKIYAVNLRPLCHMKIQLLLRPQIIYQITVLPCQSYAQLFEPLHLVN